MVLTGCSSNPKLIDVIRGANAVKTIANVTPAGVEENVVTIIKDCIDPVRGGCK
tara:strand:+ start:58 stop:219 length:162 start_codon:yes stop_codon:yes gene_type:complete